MKRIYWNEPVGTDKVVFMVTDKSVDDLKAAGIIPNDSKVLVKDATELKAEEYAKHAHIDKCLFDNPDNPTDIVFDLDLLKSYYVDYYKTIRANAFKLLDNLQLRAFISKKEDVLQEIEIDKQKLRDMPDNLDFSNANTAIEVSRVYPESLMVDYEQKYKSRI